MDKLMLWGRHPDYANGTWIKLAFYTLHEFKVRQNEGFELRVLPFGEHP